MTVTKTQGRRAGTARHGSRGLRAAGVMLLAGLVLVAVFAVRARLSGSPRAAEALDIPAPDIRDLGADLGPGGQSMGARGMNIQLQDPDEPGRLRGELRAEAMDPQPARRYLVTHPEAWLYLKNGWLIYIRADRGDFYIPEERKQPERGLFEGAVLCEAYPAPADRPPLRRATLDRARDRAGAVMKTESLTFDASLGTLSTHDRVELTSDEVDFAGTGLKMAVNQVRERLNMLEVAQGEYIRYRRPAYGDAPPAARPAPAPVAPKPAAPRTGPAARPAPAPPPVEKPAPAAPPTVTLYTAQFEDNVTVNYRGRTVEADRLDSWTRLIGNSLPDGAIADLPRAAPDSDSAPGADAPGGVPPASRAEPMSERGPPSPSPARAHPGPQPDVTAHPAPSPTDTDETLTLRWAGPMRIRPLDDEPEELRPDHVFFRFTAEKSGLVRLADPAREMTGRCAALEYGATTRRLTLSGLGRTGPAPASVAFNLGEYEARLGRIEMDLGLGAGKVPGPGLARNTRTGQQASWTEQANFQFRMLKDAEGRDLFGGLQALTLWGDGEVRQEDASASGDSIRAEFIPRGAEATTLDRVFIRGRARAGDGRAKSLGADEIDVVFGPGDDPRQPNPTLLVAEGDVQARDGPSAVRAGRLDADLARRDGGRIDVLHARMTGGARFEQDDGIRPRIIAEAGEIDADPIARTADLVAAEGGIARVVRGGAELTGPRIALDGASDSAWVAGPGAFESKPDRRTPGAPVVSASWTREMRFDDSGGLLDASGDVRAESAPDAMSLDKAAADRLVLRFTPGRRPSESDGDPADAGPSAPPFSGGATGAGSRRILSARAEGKEGGPNAAIESWRFVADEAAPGGRRPERVVYLDGPLILADHEGGTADVEGPGRLLSIGARYFQADGPAPDPGARIEDGAAGGSVFTWRGSMHIDRASGAARFARGVRLNHKPRRDAPLVELECEDLAAKIAESAAAGPDGTVAGDLAEAEARGAVWLRSATRELIADRLSYDARAARAEARAEDDNRVTIFDRTQATTLTAARLVWDLEKDRIEIVDPGTVTAPR